MARCLTILRWRPKRDHFLACLGNAYKVVLFGRVFLNLRLYSLCTGTYSTVGQASQVHFMRCRLLYNWSGSTTIGSRAAACMRCVCSGLEWHEWVYSLCTGTYSTVGQTSQVHYSNHRISSIATSHCIQEYYQNRHTGIQTDTRQRPGTTRGHGLRTTLGSHRSIISQFRSWYSTTP